MQCVIEQTTKWVQHSGMVLTLLLLTGSISKCQSCGEVRTIEVEPDQVKYVQIHPGEQIKIYLTFLPSGTEFIVIQAHTYKHPVILSYDSNPDEYSSVRGRDVGLVSIPKDDNVLSWFITSQRKCQSREDFRMLLLVSHFGKGVPIPGGCNMEFPLEIDPNLHIINEHEMDIVQFQYARQVKPKPRNCDVQYQKSLQYILYQQYIPSGENAAFRSIEEILTNNSGHKVHAFNSVDKTELYLASFMGKGVIYNVKVIEAGLPASYIPIRSYGCPDNQIHCTYISSGNAVSLIGVILLGFAGMFICFLGHRFFKTEMFLFGFFGGFTVSYILVDKYTELDVSWVTLVAVAGGVIGGTLWLALWCYKGIPIVSVLLVGLVTGYLVASIIFNLTPVGGWRWWHSPLNYGLAFASAVLLLPTFLLAFTKTMNIVCCAVLGSYLVVFAIDVFVQGSISLIVLLSLRKARWDDMLKAVIVLPYQWSDVLFSVFWVMLAVGGATVQFIRERHRADFPPCPWQRRQLHESWLTPVIVEPTAPPARAYEADAEEDDENEPLLQALRQMESQTTKRDRYDK